MLQLPAASAPLLEHEPVTMLNTTTNDLDLLFSSVSVDDIATINCTELENYLLPDKIQIAYQSLAAAVGLPINVLFFTKIVRQLIKDQNRAVLYLQLLLTSCNSAVLLHCVWHTVWLCQFWWSAGYVTCKLFSFFRTFVFYLYSNCVAVTALQMLIAIWCPLLNYRYCKRVVFSLTAGAVVCAALASVPQPVFWDLTRLSCSETGSVVAQCSYSYSDRTWYNLFHNLLVFWIPLTLIVPAYVIVCWCVWCHYRSNVPNANRVTKQPQPSLVSATSVINLSQRSPTASTTVLSESAALKPTLQHRTSPAPLRQKLSLQVVRCPKTQYCLSKAAAAIPASSANGVRPSLSCDKLEAGAFTNRRPSSSMPLLTVGGSEMDLAKRRQSQPASGLRRTFQNMEKIKSKQLKAVKSSLTIVSLYVLSWIPYQISSIWTMTASASSNENDYLKITFECLEALMYAGPVLSPFLYSFSRAEKNKKKNSMSKSLLTMPKPQRK